MAVSIHSTEGTPTLTVGDEPLSLEQVEALASGRARPSVSQAALTRIRKSYELMQRRLLEGQNVYGVTTGYGNSSRTHVRRDLASDLSQNLVRFHGCGTGRYLTEFESAAVLAVRLCSLTAGCSGVRPEVIGRLCELLERRILPAIPAEGSVGASGDLTPLSYVAAVLVGEREVLDLRSGQSSFLSASGEGATPVRLRPAADALAECDLRPMKLQPKEALALMNGTSVATALSVSALLSAERLARLAARVTALASFTCCGNPEHFDPFVHQVKGHPGQVQAASWIRAELARLPWAPAPARLQDRYSIRCAPHVLGVLLDALHWFRTIVSTELNGVSDNPVVDAERQLVLHGGNFYGGHVSFAMDGLKAAVASVADMLDRQLVLLCLPGESAGLPENLVGERGDAACTHHGFKAMSISASALTAEALKLTMPASAFSRSTEAHNQDKVPMATIAARDALRVVELTEQVAAISVLAACQAAELRGREQPADAQAAGTQAGGSLGSLHRVVRQHVPFLSADRRMDRDIAQVLQLIRQGALEEAEPEGS